MVYCLQGEIVFGSAVRRDQARADLESFIANRPRWSVDEIGSGADDDGLPTLGFALRFVAEVDAQALEDRIKTFLVNQRVPRDGSRLWGHRCKHDETDHGVCVVQREAVVQGGVWVRTV